MDLCSGFTKAHDDVKNSQSNFVVNNGFTMYDSDVQVEDKIVPRLEMCVTNWDTDDFNAGESRNATTVAPI